MTMTESLRKTGDNVIQEDIVVYQDSDEQRETNDSLCPNHHALRHGTRIQRYYGKRYYDTTHVQEGRIPQG